MQERRLKTARIGTRIFGLAVGLVVLGACADEEPRMEMPPAPRSSAAAASTTAAAAPATVVEQLLQDTQRSASLREARDPFMPYYKRPEAGPTELVARTCDLVLHPLGDTELSNIKLAGLITGTPVPRAMILVTGNPQAFMLTEGALAGGDCNYKLTEIRENEIVWVQQSMVEEDRVEVPITLNDIKVNAQVTIE